MEKQMTETRILGNVRRLPGTRAGVLTLALALLIGPATLWALAGDRDDDPADHDSQSFEELEEEMERLAEEIGRIGGRIATEVAEHTTELAGLEALTPLWLLKYLPNMLACHVGIIHDIQGPSNSITCGESGAYLAIGEAVQVIDRGCADVALAGGCEAKVNPIVMIRQCLLKRATSENNDDPKTACRPFDADAKG